MVDAVVEHVGRNRGADADSQVFLRRSSRRRRSSRHRHNFVNEKVLKQHGVFVVAVVNGGPGFVGGNGFTEQAHGSGYGCVCVFKGFLARGMHDGANLHLRNIKLGAVAAALAKIGNVAVDVLYGFSEHGVAWSACHEPREQDGREARLNCNQRRFRLFHDCGQGLIFMHDYAGVHVRAAVFIQVIIHEHFVQWKQIGELDGSIGIGTSGCISFGLGFHVYNVVRFANGVVQRFAIGVVFAQRGKIRHDVFVGVELVVPARRAVPDHGFNLRRDAVFVGLKQPFRNHGTSNLAFT